MARQKEFAIPINLSVKSLQFNYCDNLQKISAERLSKNIKEFVIDDCNQLEVLPNLQNSFIEFLSIESTSLKELPCLKKIKHLQTLMISCPLSQVLSLESSSLKKLKLFNFPARLFFRKMNLKSLKSIKFDSSEVKELPSICQLTSLREIKIYECTKLERLPSMCHLTKLTKLEICEKTPLTKEQLILEILETMQGCTFEDAFDRWGSGGYKDVFRSLDKNNFSASVNEKTLELREKIGFKTINLIR